MKTSGEKLLFQLEEHLMKALDTLITEQIDGWVQYYSECLYHV